MLNIARNALTDDIRNEIDSIVDSKSRFYHLLNQRIAQPYKVSEFDNRFEYEDSVTGY
jgi:hypothetical protein